MTATVTHGDILATPGTLHTRRQDAQLAALIRRLADLRPEIAVGWTPLPAPAPALSPVPAPRPPRFLPDPRFLHPLEPHPVTGRRPTREDFPADRDVVDSIARLRAEAAGTHRPGDHWPAHATPAYYARKTRPSRLRQIVLAVTRARIGGSTPRPTGSPRWWRPRR